MFPITNPTLHLHILQFLLIRPRRVLLLALLPILLPRHARSENYILAHRGSVEAWARGVIFFETEFRPGAPRGNAGVDGCGGGGGFDAAGCFDAFGGGVVEAVGGYGFGAVFVGGYGLRGEGARVWGLG